MSDRHGRANVSEAVGKQPMAEESGVGFGSLGNDERVAGQSAVPGGEVKSTEMGGKQLAEGAGRSGKDPADGLAWAGWLSPPPPESRRLTRTPAERCFSASSRSQVRVSLRSPAIMLAILRPKVTDTVHSISLGAVLGGPGSARGRWQARQAACMQRTAASRRCSCAAWRKRRARRRKRF